MTHELHEILTERAERGEHRGADAVMARTRHDMDRSVEPSGTRSAPRRSRLVAAGVAAVATAVVGGGTLLVAMLSGPDETPATDAPIAATTEATTTTPAPEPMTTIVDTSVPPIVNPPTAQDPIDWYRTTLGDDGDVVSIAANAERAVAIGEVDDTLAVWTSIDGTGWDRVAYDDAVFGAGDAAEMLDVVAGPNGFVIVGSTRIGFDRYPTVWTSSDGLAWERIQLDGAALGFDGPIVLNAVTHGVNGFVTVGWTTPEDEPWMLDDHVVLRSDDGTTWEPAAGLDELPLGGMWDVTGAGPGYVAVGVDWSVTGVGRAGVWLSADGLTWDLVDREAIECDVCDDIELMNVVTTDGERIIATGAGSNVWASVDGTDWDLIGKHHPPTDAGVYAEGVILNGDRIVAVGSLEYSGDPDPDGSAAWTSEDGGETWKASMLPESVFGGSPGEMAMRDLIRFGGLYVAVGDWNGAPTLWVGEWNGEDGS